MAQILNDIKEMKKKMEKAAKKAKKFKEQADFKVCQTNNIQEEQKLGKIINETERLQKHIEKAIEIVNAELPDPPVNQRDDKPQAPEIVNAEPPDPPGEPPKAIEVLKLQQEIYKVLKETKEKCKNNFDNLKKKIQEIQDDMWNEYYMKIACLAALRSKDPSTPVS